MEPFANNPGGMISIELGKEIELIRQRLKEMGELGTGVKRSTSGFEKVDNPIAKHKVKQAKLRKKKRKNGGPR